MNKQREALQMALDTLRGWIGIDEWIWPVTAKETCKKNSLEAITAIREALAEPEPEPVARVKTVGGYPDASEHTVEWLVKFKDVMSGQLLYAAPPARKPLTYEEVSEIIQSMSAYTWDVLRLARAIERAHGIGET